MTRSAFTSQSLSGPAGRPDWHATGGLAVILVAALLPLHGVALYVDVNHFDRWAYTDPLFALVALVTAGLMVRNGVPPAAPLYVVVAAATVIIGGSGYGLWHCYHHAPGEDDYLSSATFVLGFFVVGVIAAIGIPASLLARRRPRS